MSELNDYLEGKITFEEFERKAKDKVYYTAFSQFVNLFHVLHSESIKIYLIYIYI